MRIRFKSLVPAPLRALLGPALVRARARRLAQMPVAEAFDEIYRRRLWQQGESLSGLGSEGEWADDYVDFVKNYVGQNDCRTIVDVGCGDFRIGSQIAPIVDTYHAFDISKTIINLNRKRYAHLSNVHFSTLDVTNGKLPESDLLLVRQVFQHLSNAQVEAGLATIEHSPHRHVLITEHIYDPSVMVRPNIDLQTHSVKTRVALKSGIDIGAPPFSRRREVLAIFPPEIGGGAEPDSVLCIYSLSPGLC